MTNITLFSQIISLLDRGGFTKLVTQYRSDKHQKGYPSWAHLVAMLFCQFANSQSVRDISNGLRSATGNLHHLGVYRAPSKSTISYQNKHRDWRLFRDYYYTLLDRLGQQMKFKRVKFRIRARILLLDATTISLCLSLFDWARYKTAKGAIKVHTLLDYDGHCPVYVHVTDGKTGDNKGARDIPLMAGSVVVGDRFYNDFNLLHIWDSNQVYFVIRHKENLQYEVVRERPVNVEGASAVHKDQIIRLTGPLSSKKYPKTLRRVVVWDAGNEQFIELLTNQKTWVANTIGALYKARWQVEIFFREIKQLLRIKSFIGTSQNAVMIQIWTAMITILLLKALKAMAQYGWHLSNLVAFIRLNLFVKIDLKYWLDTPFNNSKDPPANPYQGVLFKI